METNLVAEGLKFMALGMGTVLVFLIIMIVFMILQAKIINRFLPEPQTSQPDTATTQQKKQSVNNKVAAITAAIMHHNQSK
jgi:oxaloacetate decarboxylase gamma subunit